MSNDLNLCNFIGRLGKPPDIRHTPSGEMVTSFSIACGWKTKSKEGVEWVNVTAFGKLAEICGEYLVKGSQVYISGRMQTDKWQDKETGKDRYTTKIIADKMQMLGVRPQTDSQEPREEKPAAPGGGGFDDDIPF